MFIYIQVLKITAAPFSISTRQPRNSRQADLTPSTLITSSTVKVPPVYKQPGVIFTVHNQHSPDYATIIN